MNLRSRRLVPAALTILTCAGMAFAQPADQMDNRPPPPPDQREGRPGGPPDQMPETFDRSAVKKRLENRLKELSSAQERLQKALEKLDSGAPLTDVWGELGPAPGSGRFSGGPGGPAPGNLGERYKERLGERGKGKADGKPDGKPGDREMDREGGPKPRGDRRRGDMSDGLDAAAVLNLPPGNGEPLNGEEREKLFRYLDENMPRVAERFHSWQKLDPEGFDIFLSRMAPRVREAGAVLRRDPDGAKLRMEEVEKGLDVLDSTQKIRELYLTPDPDQAKLAEARESLKTALGAQLDARFAVHQHQISTLERQIQELRKQAEDMSAKKAERVSERAAAFEASIRERATKPAAASDDKPREKPHDKPHDKPEGDKPK